MRGVATLDCSDKCLQSAHDGQHLPAFAGVQISVVKYKTEVGSFIKLLGHFVDRKALQIVKNLFRDLGLRVKRFYFLYHWLLEKRIYEGHTIISGKNNYRRIFQRLDIYSVL